MEPTRDAQKRDPAATFDVRAVLRAIAVPRLTGSTGAAEVTTIVRTSLEASGYDVRERPFLFNPWPGRFGITAVGAVYLAATVSAALLLHGNNPYAAIALLLIMLVAVLLVAVFATQAIDALPFGRQRGTNLFARRPDSRPRYIVMAHRDSKSQPLPLALRGPVILLAGLTWVALLAGAAMHTAQPLPANVITALGALAVLAGAGLVLCWVDNNSAGALDNASGVVAALGIAAREAEAGDVAFLITDAEELGLAGARAAAAHLPPVIGVINLDGLDDDGRFYVFERFGMIRRRGVAPHLAAALLQEADARHEPAVRRDLPFGIPVDHIPLADAGLPALTVMRGSLRSLHRVHRPGDTTERLLGDGIRRTIDLVCGAFVRLREQTRALER